MAAVPGTRRSGRGRSSALVQVAPLVGARAWVVLAWGGLGWAVPVSAPLPAVDRARAVRVLVSIAIRVARPEHPGAMRRRRVDSARRVHRVLARAHREQVRARLALDLVRA